jgi:plasmid stabilization system protein ParE
MAAYSPQAARSVQMRLKAIIALPLRHPHIGRLTNDPAIRRLTITPYPYLVFYEATGTEIIIHAIRHSAQDPSSMPGNS